MAGWVIRGIAPDDQAAVGSRAPDFSVDVIDGGTFTLSEHLDSDGRPLVLNLWASWCIPCRREIPEISDFSLTHPNVKVLGVAVDDTVTKATVFAREIDPPYEMALGDDVFETAYPRIGLPVTYLIDSDGVITEMFNGVLDAETLVELTEDW